MFKQQRYKTSGFIVALFSAWCLVACEKFLDEKPDIRLDTIDEIKDILALLDDHRRINEAMIGIGTSSADEYYLYQTDFNAIGQFDRQAYVWATTNLFSNTGTNDWSSVYGNIYKTNVVLWHIDKVKRKPGDEEDWKTAKGNALMLRGLFYLTGAQVWCNSYDAATASADLGLPLRLDPDFDKVSIRSSLEDTYRQILSDLKEAAELLPTYPPHVVRPSRPAAWAFLARAYLGMRIYDSAAHYAGLSLQYRNQLYDYNDIPQPNSNFPFAPKYSHPEIIMDLETNGPPATLNANRSKVDSNLYRQFHTDDLRRTVYFQNNSDGSVRFKGSLVGSVILFEGPTVAEMMLVKAECLARKNDPAALATANDLLNELLLHRYRTGTYTPVEVTNQQLLLDTILAERKKELLLRGQRWADIKRLNKEGYNIVQTRFVNNEWITLQPNSNRYATPIPEDVIRVTGMQQNP